LAADGPQLGLPKGFGTEAPIFPNVIIGQTPGRSGNFRVGSESIARKSRAPNWMRFVEVAVALSLYISTNLWSVLHRTKCRARLRIAIFRG